MEKKTVHLMGICGTAMASLAGILKASGWEVRGSDQNVYPPMSDMLQNLGIEILAGYKAENLQPSPDLVIVGNVISRGNPELEALLQSDIPYTSLAACLGERVIADRDSYVVAGTHGKSTTTSLLAWVLECLDKKPGFLVGAVPLNFGLSFRAPEASDCFVIEGDEYDTAFFDKVPKFIHYRPKNVILNSIEFDHADIYADLEAVKKAFRMLLDRIPAGADSPLLYLDRDQNIRELLRDYPELTAFSFGEQGDYSFRDLQLHDQGASFTFVSPQGESYFVQSPLYGRFNVWNVMAVLAMVHCKALDMTTALKAVAGFKGLKRRQEKIHRSLDGRIQVIEDFAHHPTAVKLLLQAMRESFPQHRLISFFEPRSATSRRKVFYGEYLEAFALSDVVFLKEAFDQQKIKAEDRFRSEEFVADLQEKYPQIHAHYFADLERVWPQLKQETTEGPCLILIMSNGAFDGIYEKIKAHIP